MSRKSCIFFSIGIAGGFFGQIKVERRGVIQVQIKVKPSGLKFEGLRYRIRGLFSDSEKSRKAVHFFEIQKKLEGIFSGFRISRSDRGINAALPLSVVLTALAIHC